MDTMQEQSQITDIEQELSQALQKVQNQYQQHTQKTSITDQGLLLTLKPKTHKDYNGFQSRPDMKIGLAVAQALKETEVDPKLYRFGFKQGTEKDAVKIELRPFNMDQYEKVL